MTQLLHRTETGYLLNKAARRWNAAFVALLRDTGIADIKPSFGAVMVPLYEEDGLRLGEVAARAGLSKQTVTSLVRRIEDIGYVERRADARDGRATRLHLTAKARAVEPAVESVLGHLDRLTSGLAGSTGFQPVAAWLRSMAEQQTLGEDRQ
jgi:DNA-binding MarR family transcriptional regulator